MSTEKTADFERGDAPVLVKLIIGLMSGLLFIWILGPNPVLAVILLASVVLLVNGLNDFRAWLVLLLASLTSGFMYKLGNLTVRPDQVALIILIIGWLAAWLTGKAKIGKIPLLLPLSLYLGVNVLSSYLYADDKGASYQGTLLLFLYVLMYIMTCVVLNEHPDKMKFAVKAFLLFAAIEGIYAFISLVAFNAGVNTGGVNPAHVESAVSLNGGFQEPNLLGAFMAVTSLTFLAFLTGKQEEIRNRYLFAGMIIVSASLVLAYTRAAWVGFLVALCLLFFLQKPTRNLFNPRAAAVIMAIIAAVTVAALPFANSLARTELSTRVGEILDFNSTTASGRLDVQRVAIQGWKHAVFFGNGTLSFSNKEFEVSGSWLYSSMVQALYDTGLVGLLFQLWFQVGVVVILIRSYMKTTDGFYRAALTGFIAGSVAMMIASQASSFLWLGFPWVFAGLAVATAHAAVANSKKNSTQPSQS